MIFESPDGGKTVTARVPHTLTQQSVNVDPFDQAQVELNEKWFMWKDVLWASKNNPALREALDRAQVIYELSRREV